MIKDLNGATLAYDTENNLLVIVDQTLLPREYRLLYLDELEDIFEAIRSLRVRGAPAIGAAAAVGYSVLVNKIKTSDKTEFKSQADFIENRLRESRPTAVNLFWALDRMEKALENALRDGIDSAKEAVKNEALFIIDEDIEMCRKIGEHGAALLKDGDTVLTHCNAGSLATVKYGTALSPVYVAAEQGKKIKVFADETRPLLQGARLTAFELTNAGIDTTVICDNMAAKVMSEGKVNAIFVGADRIAANGDTANKIGTLSLAVNARFFGVPFYVCAPYSTFDKDTPDGGGIVIEERADSEIRSLHYKESMLPDKAKVYNPAFDVTPAELITAFITPDGIIAPKDISKLFAK
ncbi:MAG: S-methyl-5-thioribose-1-phosphate isomerase [Clostridiales bacterium]|jgi:methylthioribose-1-phosphate isomerase|nr:S-methyl-5-thioribose-1-phosphate isomerase [Clostridiales bacterium]HOA33947.1 S-methyl-5-thioribose-1-phosphate isomerase [Clostridiales bacterium]HOJ35426.1 S-methyl-5-thioribose-1-phosphate isomerase [Clostridiales bacterium]HPU66734.1 S-methyl-5-thioribose-1-phosphate isomerase [Clostridiales bacterium]HQA05323.1 S-methyl-5-thioribose-1-phosphate isomerase [Clostridiales bacterium]